MSLQTIFLYLVASFLLFTILSYTNRKTTSNYIHHIAVTLIYIIILSGIFTTYHLTETNTTIFLIPVLELLIRVFHTNYLQEKNFLKNNKYYLKIYAFSISLSYLTNTLFINNVKNVFPEEKELKIIIWLLITAYLYKFLKDNITKIDLKTSTINFSQDKEYIVMQYAKLKSQYSNIIKTKYNELIPLIYSIMIYENYYKPNFLRKIDKLKYKIDSEERKFGIMQIKSQTIITDEESIKIAINRLERKYFNLLRAKKKFNAYAILSKYYPKKSSLEEITNIYNTIIKFNQL